MANNLDYIHFKNFNSLKSRFFQGILLPHVTQFKIEGGGLVQGVTKLITILLTFVP